MAKFKIGDKVEILDGSKIPNYMGGFSIFMRDYIGKTATIKKVHDNPLNGTYYEVKEVGYVWDERGLKLASDHNEKIVITTDGKTTTVKKYDGKTVVKTATAKCSPDDTFDFDTGAKIAFHRLIGFVEPTLESTFDWDAFKRRKIFVKVTKKNWRKFVSEAKTHGFNFYGGEVKSPFEMDFDKFARKYMKSIVEVKPDEIFILYENGVLKYSHISEGETVFVW